MVDRYNEKVEQASGKVLWKLAFTIFGAGLGFFTGGPLGATAGAALSLIQFTTLDLKPRLSQATFSQLLCFTTLKRDSAFRFYEVESLITGLSIDANALIVFG